MSIGGSMAGVIGGNSGECSGGGALEGLSLTLVCMRQTFLDR